MGNQGLSRSCSVSSSSLLSKKSNLLTIKASMKAMKSDLSLNDHKTSSTINEEMLASLSDSDKTFGTPTVFRWNGKGTEIHISGSFNNWKKQIPMVKSDNVFYTIIKCEPGHHSYKFLVDGVWMHDDTQPTELNPFGTLNNQIDVDIDDFNVDLALSYDEAHSKKTAEGDYNEDPEREYSQEIPRRPNPVTGMTMYNLQPRTLPPHLSETILNTEVAQHHDPALLITPFHVQVNHLYASSISAGIASLSVTLRYRTKYITTLFYKPITD